MKILLTSDWHKTPFKEEKFQTQKKNLGERIIQFLGGIGADAVMEQMEKVIREKVISIVIHNGDMMESSRNERGLSTSKDLQEAMKIRDTFISESGVNRFILNAGNHELGYVLPLSTDPNGGISSMSMYNFVELAGCDGDFFQVVLVDGFKIILIPYLFSEDEAAIGHDLLLWKKVFLRNLKRELSESESTVLLLHDPDSLADENLLRLISLYREKIKLIFCGHYHAEATLRFVKWLVRIFNSSWLLPIRCLVMLSLWPVFGWPIAKAIREYFRKRKNIPDLIKELNVQIIPAPGGMLGFGGGFLILNLFEDGKFEIEKHLI